MLLCFTRQEDDCGRAFSDKERVQIVAAARSESVVGIGSRFFEGCTTLYARLGKGLDCFEEGVREFVERSSVPLGSFTVSWIPSLLRQA